MGVDWAAIREKFRAECAEIVTSPPRQAPVEPEPEPVGLHYHGKPCPYGHGTLRYRSSWSCVVCARTAVYDRKVTVALDEEPSLAEKRISLMATLYEQEFDRAGWRKVAVPERWE